MTPQKYPGDLPNTIHKNELKINTWSHKTPRRKHRGKDPWHWSRQWFPRLVTKTQETETKINKWDYIKLNSFWIAKETINTLKRQPIEWEKIFINYVSDKALITKIYKELMQFNSKKKENNLIKNGQRTWIGIFPKETYKCPTDLWKHGQYH